jgi:hypothetical protein
MKHEPSGARLLPANPLAAGLVAGEATAEGHAALAAQLDTSIATGEMLTSVATTAGIYWFEHAASSGCAVPVAGAAFARTTRR